MLELTEREIGQKLNLTRDQVAKRKKKAFDPLREKLADYASNQCIQEQLKEAI